MKPKIVWGLVIFLFCCTVGEIIVFKILSRKLEISSKKTLTSKKAATRPSRKVKESSEIEKELSFETMTDEELEECLAWLDELEEQDETIEQAKHNEEMDNSSSTYNSWSENVPQSENSSQSKPAEEVLDALTDWPASGIYYLRDILRYRPEHIADNFRAQVEAMLAANPNAFFEYGNPRDPNSGVMVYSNGRLIPGYIYFSEAGY